MTCQGCPREVPASQGFKPRKWCSEACRVKTWHEAHPLKSSAMRAADKERVRAKRIRPTYQLVCRQCGKAVVAHSAARVYCTKKCSLAAFNAARRADGRSADMSAKRRAFEKGAKVSAGTRRDVATRDRWTCQLCHLAVPPEALYPEPLSGVVDHVVALVHGGEHGPSNWQLAHAFCNALKSDLDMATFQARYPDIADRLRSRVSALTPA